MSEAPDGEREPFPYIRLPWPAVAAVLLVFVALLLAAGLFANRNLRPQVRLVPTNSAVALAVPAITVLATQAPTPLVAPTTARPTSTEVPAVTAHAASPTQSSAFTPTPRPTIDPALASEVSKAFDEYWQVRSQALLELDSSHLRDAMAGDHLESMTRRIDELRSENRAIKTDVDHEIHIVQVSPDAARVVDDYISNTIYVDPITKQPLSEPASDELRVLYQLQKLDGTWKVVDSVSAD